MAKLEHEEAEAIEAVMVMMVEYDAVHAAATSSAGRRKYGEKSMVGDGSEIRTAAKVIECAFDKIVEHPKSAVLHKVLLRVVAPALLQKGQRQERGAEAIKTGLCLRVIASSTTEAIGRRWLS